MYPIPSQTKKRREMLLLFMSMRFYLFSEMKAFSNNIKFKAFLS